MLNEVKVAEIIERFKKLGRFTKGKDHDVLLQPHACADDEVVIGKSLSPGRVEHLRKVAHAAGIPEDKTTDEANFSERILEFTASDESRDRYGDRILVDGTMVGDDGQTKKYGKGWNLGNFKKNPVFMAFHQYSPDAGGSQFAGIPLGNALETWTDTYYRRKRLRMSVLMDDGTSNPVAPFITNAYKNRLMRAVSVGFWPEKVYQPADENERGVWNLGQNGYLFGQQELWENSAVSIPANPNALMENGAPLWDSEQAKKYDRFAEEIKEVSPEFAYQLRSALSRGRSTVEVKGEPEPETPADPPVAPEEKDSDGDCMGAHCGGCSGKSKSTGATMNAEDVKAALDAINKLAERVDAGLQRLATLLEGAEVPTRGKAKDGDDASNRSAEPTSEADPYENLLSEKAGTMLGLLQQQREAFRATKG